MWLSDSSVTFYFRAIGPATPPPKLSCYGDLHPPWAKERSVARRPSPVKHTMRKRLGKRSSIACRTSVANASPSTSGDSCTKCAPTRKHVRRHGIRRLIMWTLLRAVDVVVGLLTSTCHTGFQFALKNHALYGRGTFSPTHTVGRHARMFSCVCMHRVMGRLRALVHSFTRSGR